MMNACRQDTPVLCHVSARARPVSCGGLSIGRARAGRRLHPEL
jgi:hypothetical protein